jgi:predicted DCC family thiol-disulfide oxidoreductase YuxK/uncharacterized membrane protein YphA (DoxX/SURF4 family)
MADRSPISRWIFEEFRLGEKSLAMSRMLVAISLLIFEYPRYFWMAKFPESFYLPPLGLGSLFHQQPPGWVMWSLMAALTVMALGLLVGWKTRVMAIGLAFVTLVANSFDYSHGKINHDIMWVAVLFCIAFSGAERRYSVDACKRTFSGEVPGWPLAMLAMIVSLGMLAAALPKIMSGWLDLNTQMVRGHLIDNMIATSRPTWVGSLMLKYGSTAFWEFLDWSTIAIEAAFIFAMFSRRAFVLVCALAVAFHVGIHFSMDIFFLPNLIAYGMFVQWERTLSIAPIRRFMGWYDQQMKRVKVWMLLVAGSGLMCFYTVKGNLAAWLLDYFGNGEWIRNSILALAALLVALTYLFFFSYQRQPVRKNVRLAAKPSYLASSSPLVLFDGVCGLCNRFVNWVLKYDRENVFLFAPLQSEVGRKLLWHHQLPSDYSGSIVLLMDDQVYRYSAASLKIFRHLGWPCSVLYLLVLVPPPLRDMVYNVIASNRYRWFGRTQACRVPSAEERSRFLA